VLTSAGWWFKPDFIINELNINSAFAKPWHDEFVNLAQSRPYTLKGYAYTGAQRRVALCFRGPGQRLGRRSRSAGPPLRRSSPQGRRVTACRGRWCTTTAHPPSA
jgi:hypothetical protein